MWEGGRPLQQIEQLDWLLTQTPLRTLPLWLLGTDYVQDRIAWRHDDGTGALLYARALTWFVTRDYLRAASTLADAEQRGLRGDTVSGATKPARLETGAGIQVPLFVNKGDVVKVDTRTGTYIERV